MTKPKKCIRIPLETNRIRFLFWISWSFLQNILWQWNRKFDCVWNESNRDFLSSSKTRRWNDHHLNPHFYFILHVWELRHYTRERNYIYSHRLHQRNVLVPWILIAYKVFENHNGRKITSDARKQFQFVNDLRHILPSQIAHSKIQSWHKGMAVASKRKLTGHGITAAAW